MLLTGLCALFIGCGTLFACDYCNLYLSINPGFNQNAIGLRYRTSTYVGFHTHDHEEGLQEDHDHGEEMYEHYNTYSVWGRWCPTAKLKFIANLQYADNYIIEGDHMESHVSGLGDAIVIGQYQLFNSTPDSTKHFRQRLFAGGGVKFPIGNFRIHDENGEMEPTMQPGSGSWDFVLSTNYMLKIGWFGVNTNVLYHLTTQNVNGFRHANKFNVTSSAFAIVSKGKFRFIPNTGLYLEQAVKDADNGVLMENSGGLAMFNQTGLDVYLKSFALNFACQIPVYEMLNGEQGSNKTRFVFGIRYAFG